MFVPNRILYYKCLLCFGEFAAKGNMKLKAEWQELLLVMCLKLIVLAQKNNEVWVWMHNKTKSSEVLGPQESGWKV